MYSPNVSEMASELNKFCSSVSLKEFDQNIHFDDFCSTHLKEAWRSWCNSPFESDEEKAAAEAIRKGLYRISCMGTLSAEEIAFIKAGKKILAIKSYRERHVSVNFADAKAWIEQHWHLYEPPKTPNQTEQLREVYTKLLCLKSDLDYQIDTLKQIITGLEQ